MQIKNIYYALLVISLGLNGCNTVLKSSHNRISDSIGKESGAYYFLPKGKIRLQVLKKGDEISLNYKETIYEPDPELFFSLRYNSSITAYDQVKIDISGSGLLDKITVTSDEKTDEIIIKIAEIAKEAIKLGTVMSFVSKEKLDAGEKLIFETIIDPTNDIDIANFNNELTNLYLSIQNEIQQTYDHANSKKTTKLKTLQDGIYTKTQELNKLIKRESELFEQKLAETDSKKAVKIEQRRLRIDNRIQILKPLIVSLRNNENSIKEAIRTNQVGYNKRNNDLKKFRLELSRPVNLRAQKTGTSAEEAESLTQNTVDIDNCLQGVCFRPVLPYRLMLKDQDGRMLGDKMLHLPNESPILSLDVTRASFVEKITILDFENGILKSVEIKKPSEALAFLDIPLTIIKSFAALPSELIQLKINHSTNEKNLADAKRNELDAKQKLLEYQQELLNKQKNQNMMPIN